MEQLLSKYRGLFEQSNGQNIEVEQGNFGSKWALFTVIEAMADLYNISINKVYRLRAIEFLNWWAYIQEKTQHENSKIKK